MNSHRPKRNTISLPSLGVSPSIFNNFKKSQAKKKSYSRLRRQANDDYKQNSLGRKARLVVNFGKRNSVSKGQTVRANLLDDEERKATNKVQSNFRYNSKHLKAKLGALQQQSREKKPGVYLCRRRLARVRKAREDRYSQNVDSLIFNTNKEFHSLSFASNLKKLLVPKWTEDPRRFLLHSELTSADHDRVNQIMQRKFGRFS
ncbi:unnamed protein product [Moneuplotes crassus]|uniref:Uncharacterized protein n=1 Tax=Euplotes crassus TaxID=5936 RepID=A0AAD1XUM3_EUPCR|nr:unnamed protein product [Moneuplotes crassus]